MEQQYVLYLRRDSHLLEWPAPIQAEFGPDLNYYIYFEDGSESESRFVALCKEFCIENSVSGRRELGCLKRGIAAHPFFYLYAQQDREYPLREFMDFSHSCSERTELICHSGAKQKYKIVIDPLRSKRLDIMGVNGSVLLENSLIVSQRLRNLLISSDLTGYSLTPCLDTTRRYSESDLLFETVAPEFEDSAHYYQLLVKARTKGNPHVGVVTGKRQCPICGTVYDFSTAAPSKSDDGFFKLSDLGDNDFQSFNGFISENIGPFRYALTVPLVSEKALSFFLQHGVKGLKSYNKMPPITYRYLDIR